MQPLPCAQGCAAMRRSSRTRPAPSSTLALARTLLAQHAPRRCACVRCCKPPGADPAMVGTASTLRALRVQPGGMRNCHGRRSHTLHTLHPLVKESPCPAAPPPCPAPPCCPSIPFSPASPPPPPPPSPRQGIPMPCCSPSLRRTALLALYALLCGLAVPATPALAQEVYPS